MFVKEHSLQTCGDLQMVDEKKFRSRRAVYVLNFANFYAVSCRFQLFRNHARRERERGKFGKKVSLHVLLQIWLGQSNTLDTIHFYLVE